MGSLTILLLTTAMLIPGATKQGQRTAKAGHGGGYCSYDGKMGPVNSKLMIAIWRGDIATVRELIAAGAELNRPFRLDCDDSGGAAQTTPLIQGIEANSFSRVGGSHLEMLEFLLRSGADPNFHTKRIGPGSALMAAAGVPNVAVLRLLLSYGARLHSAETVDLLSIAVASEDRIEVLRELITDGLDVYAVDTLGNNAIMEAAYGRNEKAVELLLKLGVAPCETNNFGESAIDKALAFDKEDPRALRIASLLRSKCGS